MRIQGLTPASSSMHSIKPALMAYRPTDKLRCIISCERISYHSQTIQDLYSSCQIGRQWTTDWIPWAKATLALGRQTAGQPPPDVELLLAKLLLAREELEDILRTYDDLFTRAHVSSTSLHADRCSGVMEVDDEVTQELERNVIASRQRRQRLIRLVQAHRPPSPGYSDDYSITTAVWTSADAHQSTAAIRTRPSSMATFDSWSDVTEYDPFDPSHVAAKTGMGYLDDDSEVCSLGTFNSHML